MSSTESESLQQSLNPESPKMKRPKRIPMYEEMLMHSRALNLTCPQHSLKGFKLSTQMGLGPRMQIGTEFNLIPQIQSDPRDPMKNYMMSKMREPYFRVMMNYVGGRFEQLVTGIPSWMMSVRTNTNHNMEFSLMKFFGNFKVKLNSLIQHEMGMLIPMYMLEFMHENSNSNQTLTLSQKLIKFNILQNLGSRWTLGFEYQQVVPQKIKALNWMGMYHRNPFETYFVRVDEAGGVLSLGSKLMIDRKTKIGTSIDLSEGGSVATLGFERKLKKWTLQSKINTLGEMRSNFKIKQGMIALKIFLAGKLREEDYSTGVHLSLDPNPQ